MTTQAVVLTVAGVCLEIVALLIVNWEQRKTDRENSQLADIRTHIDTLTLGIDELKATAAPLGAEVQGVDFAGIRKILEAGTKQANLNNRKLLLDLVDQYEKAQSLRRPAKTLAQALIGIGAVVTILGATLQ